MGDPSHTLEGNSRKRSESVSGAFPEFLPESPGRTGGMPSLDLPLPRPLIGSPEFPAISGISLERAFGIRKSRFSGEPCQSKPPKFKGRRLTPQNLLGGGGSKTHCSKVLFEGPLFKFRGFGLFRGSKTPCFKLFLEGRPLIFFSKVFLEGRPLNLGGSPFSGEDDVLFLFCSLFTHYSGQNDYMSKNLF